MQPILQTSFVALSRDLLVRNLFSHGPVARASIISIVLLYSLVQDSFQFGGIYCGAKAVVPFTLRNLVRTEPADESRWVLF